jgi:16S rRNA (cytosine967-C5)-methyltransferase
MKQSFREYHLFAILKTYSSQNLPIDVFLSHYFRAHKAVGAKDRKFVSEAVYGMIRWRGLLDHLSPSSPTWETRFAAYNRLKPDAHVKDTTIPPHVRVSFPKGFFQLLSSQFGEERALEICFESNFPAPTMVRANALKTTREELLKKWEGTFEVSPSKFSSLGIEFHKKINFFSLPEFKDGYFEMQDEASQLVSTLVNVKPGDQVLDFCAGSGGKTLAFAPQMEGRGQIYLHDIRPHALQEGKKRLRRAGIQNAQILEANDPKKETLKGKMDWILVDAPCTGSGTLRRNPDMKWKFDSATLERVTQEQRAIFEEALAFLKPTGKIVYATCSLLPQENAEQVTFFEKKFGLEKIQEFHSFPKRGEMDGFYGAVLKTSSLV